MTIAAERQVLPSEAGVPGRSLIVENRLGRPMQLSPGALNRFLPITLAAGISHTTGFAVLWTGAVLFPPHTELIAVSASQLHAVAIGWSVVAGDRPARD